MKKLLNLGISQKSITQQFNDIPDDFYSRYNHEDLLTIHQTVNQAIVPHVAVLSNDENSIEFLFYSHDFKGLLYSILSILEKYNYTVVNANINITKNNMALNTIYCLSDDIEQNDTMINELINAMQEQIFYDIVLDKYTPTREKVFKIKPEIKLLHSNHKNESMIEIICRDRHGLLPIIAKTLLSLDISTNAAKIVTVGARAEFTYWISINNQSLNKLELEELSLIHI